MRYDNWGDKQGLSGLSPAERRFRGLTARLRVPPRVRARARLRAFSFGYQVRSDLAGQLHTKKREVGHSASHVGVTTSQPRYRDHGCRHKGGTTTSAPRDRKTRHAPIGAIY